MVLPHELCISRPFSSSIFSYPRTFRNGARPDERDRHEQLGVEPESDLLAHLRDPVGREPRLPVRMVGEVGLREPRCGSGCVSLRRPIPGSPSRASRTGRCRHRARRRRPRESCVPSRRRPRSGSAPRRSRASVALRAGRDRRPHARRARPSSARASRGRTRTGRWGAAARSTGGGRCSNRPCCAASRPCASPCTRASTRPWRSPRAEPGEPRPPRSSNRR